MNIKDPAYVARRRYLLDSWLIFLASWGAFLFRVQFPQTRSFDEFHYIPSALQWLGLRENQNFEHPPLAKQLIAVGLGIFGDTPFGWRFMSTLFGAITLVGMYHLGVALFKRRDQALWVVALTFLNQMLYVQARIAMLDTFMMAFLIWSLACLVRSLEARPDSSRSLTCGGIFMALAVACKWFALVPWIIGFCLLAIQAFRSGGFRARMMEILMYWVAVPAAIYFATFMPYLLIEKNPAFTVRELLTSAQWNMLDGQRRVIGAHPYNSAWWQWPLMQRPIWYTFDQTQGPQKIRGVILLGNPVILWGGLVAILYCAYDFLKNRTAVPFLILVFWGAFTFCWVAIPRKVAFFYYYYPAAMMLSFALVYALFRVRITAIRYAFLGTALGIFIFFFPIISALKFPATDFMRWMWFKSWI